MSERAHFAARDRDVIGQIRAYIWKLTRGRRRPTVIEMAPAVAADVYQELAALKFMPDDRDVELRTLYGIDVIVTEDRAPRGVVIE